jgi:hypothetical protein
MSLVIVSFGVGAAWGIYLDRQAGRGEIWRGTLGGAIGLMGIDAGTTYSCSVLRQYTIPVAAAAALVGAVGGLILSVIVKFVFNALGNDVGKHPR